jgi:hypothetical protein
MTSATSMLALVCTLSSKYVFKTLRATGTAESHRLYQEQLLTTILQGRHITTSITNCSGGTHFLKTAATPSLATSFGSLNGAVVIVTWFTTAMAIPGPLNTQFPPRT